MQGYQLAFFTAQGRHHGGKPVVDWLLQVARGLGIQGATVLAGAEGIGRGGKVHSAHFFELADQPLTVLMAVSPDQCTALLAQLEREKANLFYVKTPVEFGVVGASGT
ncbi:MAG: DUF190 domain-containing protein [Burkholderiales bacterium]|nr:DUF190 domain-containing protein [Burkholderiales bacterium]